VAYTSDNPVLYPAFLARNRMVTHFNKDNKSQKKKLMERKSSKEYSVVFFGERRKVQVTNLPSRTLSLLTVLLRTRSAQRLSSQHFAAVPTPNIAEVMPSGFCSVHNHGFCGGPNTFCYEKHRHFYVGRHLCQGKKK